MIRVLDGMTTGMRLVQRFEHAVWVLVSAMNGLTVPSSWDLAEVRGWVVIEILTAPPEARRYEMGRGMHKALGLRGFQGFSGG